MRPIGSIFILLDILLLTGGGFPIAASAQAVQPVITTPSSGDALQGMVSIEGTSKVDGFASAEISFAYSGDPTGTWFLIGTSTQPIQQDVLVAWDTTAISDGTYDLRLRVYLSDGKTLDAVVSNLRVRNYTPVETATPTAVIPQATPLPTSTLTVTPFFTPTELPANPASLTEPDIASSIGYGGLAAVFLLFIMGVYLRLRRR